MKPTRRAATEADRPFVQNTHRRAYHELVLRVLGEWNEKEISEDFDDKWRRGGFEIVEWGTTPIGALWVTDEGSHWWLREIFLDPEYQSRGYGSALIDDTIAHANRAGKRLRLRVLRENRALALYRRLGFKEVEAVGAKVWMEFDPQAIHDSLA